MLEPDWDNLIVWLFVVAWMIGFSVLVAVS